MSNEGYVLWAEGIGKSFGWTQVLKSASVWGEPGKITTLMGRNGSGKTTLMRIAAGVLRADHGVVSYRGDVREQQSLARMARRGLMYLPQEQLVSPRYRVREHFTALASCFPAARIEDAIREGGVAHLLDQRVDSLSGGERMRVSVAMALARRPTVLITDEPLVGLAPKDQEDVARSLRGLASEGTAVITSGHDARALLELSDVIIWSVAGTTHYIGSPARALDHPQFRREYLGPRFGADGLRMPPASEASGA